MLDRAKQLFVRQQRRPAVPAAQASLRRAHRRRHGGYPPPARPPEFFLLGGRHGAKVFFDRPGGGLIVEFKSLRRTSELSGSCESDGFVRALPPRPNNLINSRAPLVMCFSTVFSLIFRLRATSFCGSPSNPAHDKCLAAHFRQLIQGRHHRLELPGGIPPAVRCFASGSGTSSKSNSSSWRDRHNARMPDMGHNDRSRL